MKGQWTHMLRNNQPRARFGKCELFVGVRLYVNCIKLVVCI